MSRLFAIDDTLTSDDWYTPAWIFDGLNILFDLDVCAPVNGPVHVPTRAFYSESDDGLTSPWHGVVWCNPPYSAPTAWCRQWAIHEPGGCLLIRADLSTSGPFTAWTAATSHYVPPKRLQFESGAGASTGAINFSTILLGKGDVADTGLARLAATYGGTTRLAVAP